MVASRLQFPEKPARHDYLEFEVKELGVPPVAEESDSKPVALAAAPFVSLFAAVAAADAAVAIHNGKFLGSLL